MAMVTNPTKVANPTGAMGAVEAGSEAYWEPCTSSHGDDLKLFLHLFEPAVSTILSKRKPEQWAFIMEKIVPQLLEAAFIDKEQAIC
jgi:hypothetical protein